MASRLEGEPWLTLVMIIVAVCVAVEIVIEGFLALFMKNVVTIFLGVSAIIVLCAGLTGSQITVDRVSALGVFLAAPITLLIVLIQREEAKTKTGG